MSPFWFSLSIIITEPSFDQLLCVLFQLFAVYDMTIRFLLTAVANEVMFINSEGEKISQYTV